MSIRLVLESVLRNCDGKRVSEQNVRALANWKPKAPRTEEIPFVVARIVLQDFTGVPLLVDLAAMRSAVARLGKNPEDHRAAGAGGPGGGPLGAGGLFRHAGGAWRRTWRWSSSATASATSSSSGACRPSTRSRWCRPGIGIVHQVNLEYLAKGVLSLPASRRRRNRTVVSIPDTLVGTDSHTTMINGLGIVGWGVGGIEAEAGMLGQPVYFLTPDVVGVHLTGALREGVTATDLALTRHADAAQGQGGGQIRRVLRPGRRGAAGGGPRHHRQHGARNTARRWASSRSTRNA